MVKYYFENETFVIEDYLNASPFASFFPAISGIDGKPLWAFYSNRYQCMGGFGVNSKDTPITPFDSALLHYQNVKFKGFRTFVKADGKFFEPFSSDKNVNTKMKINRSDLTIEEYETPFKIKVSYTTVPHKNYAGLVRKVEIKNLTNHDLNLEICDGLPIFFPDGLSNISYKELVSLMASYCEVNQNEINKPFVKFKTSTEDCSEVSEIKNGNAFYSFAKNGESLKTFVDLYNIFEEDTSLSLPEMFLKLNSEDFVSQHQETENKLPCAFSYLKKELKEGERVVFYSLFGNFKDIELFNEETEKIDGIEVEGFFKENERLINDLLSPLYIDSADNKFNLYAKQSYLDNYIRGGFPIALNNDKTAITYVFGRKHGDMERDYNNFLIPSKFYSSGTGNFRDVNQNRRSDNYFYPFIKDYNIKTFFSLIQLDGHNPLNVRQPIFIVNDLSLVPENVKEFVKNGYDVSDLYIYLREHCENFDQIFHDIISNSHEEVQADFSEGYWVDHWTYNCDLLENFVSVYPDKIESVLYDDPSYKYFYSLIKIEPRKEKYCFVNENKIRQYGSIDLKKAKEEYDKTGLDIKKTYWVTNKNNEEIKVNLASKIFNLILVKFSTLDSYQMGIEMECGKPGWNDAMNGLPGLFASGLSESVELLRLVNFALSYFDKNREVVLLKEQNDLYRSVKTNLEKLLRNEINNFTYWDNVTSAREIFREKTHLHVDGKIKEVSGTQIYSFLKKVKKVLEKGIEKAKELNEGILPAYLLYEPIKYEVSDYVNHNGFKSVKVNEFKVVKIPHFLEAQARSLKLKENKVKALHEYNLVKETDLYDKKLKFYKTCADITDAPFEIGRVHAFTKGWLERECNFLHMDYKYMLGLLKAGLYDTFFKEIKNNFVCYLDPKVYGRSTIENSSFIVPTCNPDKKIHGKGYFARLTGANAEFLDMFNIIMFGEKLFKLENNELVLNINPAIPGYFFKEDNTVTYKILNKVLVTVVNPKHIATYKRKSLRYEINGEIYESVKGKLAEDIREGLIKEIKVLVD